MIFIIKETNVVKTFPKNVFTNLFLSKFILTKRVINGILFVV